jgi:hypothetical protein
MRRESLCRLRGQTPYSSRTVRAVSPVRDFLLGAAVTRRERDERPYSTKLAPSLIGLFSFGVLLRMGFLPVRFAQRMFPIMQVWPWARREKRRVGGRLMRQEISILPRKRSCATERLSFLQRGPSVNFLTSPYQAIIPIKR